MAANIHNTATLEHLHDLLNLLAQWKVKSEVLLAALLLPLVRRDLTSEYDLAARYGEEVIEMARLAIRLIYYDGTSEMRKNDPERVAYAEKLRRLFVYAYVNVDVILLCLGERIARAGQIDRLNEIEQITWAKNTQHIYLPLLDMLGMSQVYDDIGNLCLSISEPNKYEQFAHEVFLYYKRHETLFSTIHNELYQVFEENHVIGAEIALYELTPITLHTSGKNPGSSHSPDGLCIDVRVKSIQDCYAALGLIHQHWRPVRIQQGAIQDMIASPRYNGYRALITQVNCGQDAVQFRIRSFEMEQINQRGYLAYQPQQTELAKVWWNDTKIQHIVSPPDTDRLNILTDTFVFTPTGEVVYPLRKGSTVIDFAFKVNPSFAPYARSFFVNGRQVTPEWVVRNRDLIELEYETRYTSLKPEWLQHVRTSTAKSGIRRFLKTQTPEPSKARQIIDTVLERETMIYQMRFPEDKVEQALMNIARKYDCPTLDNLYMRVQEGDIAPDAVVASMIEDELIAYIAFENGQSWSRDRIRISRSWMQEKEPLKWDRTRRVIPGAEIVGKAIGKGDHAQLVIHRKDSPLAPSGDEAVPLSWKSTPDLQEAAEIIINATPQAHVIGMILNAIYAVGKDNKANQLAIHRFDSEMQEKQLTIHTIVEGPSLDAIYKLEQGLQVIQRGDYILDFKLWQLFPGQKMLLASKRDKRRQNPYTLRQIRDQSMFFGRQDETNRIIDNILEGQTFNILYGQKRIGKTSMLHQLAEHLLPDHCDVLPVQFDSQSIAPFETVPFLAGLANAAQDKLIKNISRPEDRKGLRLREADLKDNPFAIFAAWVKQTEKKLQGLKLLFVVDEFTRAEEEYQRERLDESFFDGMQWLAGNRHIGFLLCVHDHIFNHNSRSWGLLERGEPVRLGSLDRKAAADLVQQPLEQLYEFDSGVVDQIIGLTNCHPFFIQALCGELIRQMSQSVYDRVTFDALHSAVSVVLQSGEHYFNHFINRMDESGYDTLKTIAYITDNERQWVSRDDIRSAMERYGFPHVGWQVSKSIGDLFHAGIIEGRNLQGSALYTIPVGLFHIWLRQRATHPLLSSDMRRED